MSAPPDRPVDRPAPRWPTLVVVRGLLPLGILGALTLSAAATVALARGQGMTDLVPYAAVAMLEVTSVAGTLLAIFGLTGRLRDRALVAVGVVAAVQLVAGWTAYGWFGVVGPVLLVYLVHLAAEAWQEDRGAAPVAVVASVVEPVDEVDQATDHDEDQVADEVDEPEPDEVDDRPLEGPVALVEHLRTLPVLPSERDLLATLNEYVADEHRVTRHRVKVALGKARTGITGVAS